MRVHAHVLRLARAAGGVRPPDPGPAAGDRLIGAGQGAPADSLRRALDEVFASAEYRWVEGRHPLEWLSQLWRRLGDWLDTLQATHPAWHRVLLVALILVLAGLLVHIGWIVWRVTRPTLRAPAGLVAAGARALGARAHLERAEALARDGRYVEALAHRFLAVVLQLEEMRAVVYHPAKTPAEYVAEARLDTGGRASLAALVARLYRHVFGGDPCDATAYREFGLAAGDVVRHVVPG